jgi:hypothetical protein
LGHQGDDELAGSIAGLEPLFENLRQTPRAVRDVLLIVLQRGDETYEGVRVPFHELKQVTGLGGQRLTEYVKTLERYHLAGFFEDSDDTLVVETMTVDGWPFWKDLVAYCKQTDSGLEEFVVDLKFDLLD